MVQLTKISPDQIKSFIEVAFRDDAELLEQYHISPGTLDHCVDHTCGFISENADFYKEDIEFYAVDDFGFTIIIRNANNVNELYSFGKNINYRNKETLTAWLEEVEKLIGKPYYIVLWAKNTRAINFFEKNGFIVQRSSKLLNDETKVLILKNV